MRHIALGFAALVAATSVAHAQPALVAPQPQPEAAPASYVMGGGEVGVNDGYLSGGGMLEAGTRVTDHVFVHGIATHGGTERLFSSGTGSYTQLRGGADILSCEHTGARCVFVGADLGVQHVQWSGMVGSLFDNSGDGTPVSYSRTRMIGVARLGVDMGGTHLRWRPSVELAMSDNGGNGLNVMQSLAYRF